VAFAAGCMDPQEAKGAGVWVFGGGLKDHEEASVVATDGTVTDSLYPESKQYLGGFAVVGVPSRGEALQWAANIAVACRCAPEVRESCPTRPSDRGLTTAKVHAHRSRTDQQDQASRGSPDAHSR
jgi:hypothetical protein